MKYSKLILEAINRGVQLALDDYDDNYTSNVVPIKDTIKNTNSTKELIWLHDNFVDLGLPSGTLWCRYNLGVNYKKFKDFQNNPNKYIKPIEGKKYLKTTNYSDIDSIPTAGSLCGNYFAWGETEEKDQNDTNAFSWSDYKFCNHYTDFGESTSLTKYCAHKECGDHGFIDNITELLPEDDIAYQTDKRFRMPSKEQFDELIDNCDFEWKNNYNGIKNLRGYLFKSFENGAELFLPANGYIADGESTYIGNDCFYWTRTLVNFRHETRHKSECAWCFEGWPADMQIIEYYRYYGMGIRPVYNEK